jgi:hypothetical protein
MVAAGWLDGWLSRNASVLPVRTQHGCGCMQTEAFERTPGHEELAESVRRRSLDIGLAVDQLCVVNMIIPKSVIAAGGGRVYWASGGVEFASANAGEGRRPGMEST